MKAYESNSHYASKVRECSNFAVNKKKKGLLYGFNYQTLSGSGMRLAAQIKYSFTNSLYIMVKFGATKYFDRETIGSLQQQIHSSHKEDLSLQLRYKF